MDRPPEPDYGAIWREHFGRFFPEQYPESAVPERPDVQERFERPQIVDYDAKRLETLYGLTRASVAPEWMTDQVKSFIEASYNFYQDNNGLPTEIVSLLDAIPIEYTAPEVEAVEVPTLPTGQAQYYGMTEEQWNSLDPWQRLSMRIMGTALPAAATTGAVAGVAGGGGLKGGVAGAVVGSGIGLLAEKYPALGTFMDRVFDLVWRTEKRVAGTVGLGLYSLKPGDDFTFGEFVRNLDDAWYASEHAARVMPPAGPPTFLHSPSPIMTPGYGIRSGLESLQRVLEMLGRGEAAQKVESAAKIFVDLNSRLRIEDGRWKLAVKERPPMESWQFGTTETRIIPEEQQGARALVEYMRRLDAIPPEQWEEGRAALDEEFVRRYGFQGQMRELLGSIFLDVSSYVGGWAAKLLGASGKLLGAAPEFAKAMEGAAGPAQGVQRFKALTRTMEFADYKQLSPIEKWISGAYTPDGLPKLLEKTPSGGLRGLAYRALGGDSSPIARAFGYLFHLTPESRVKELLNVGSQNIALIADRSGMNPNQFVQFLDLIAKNQIEAATQLSVKAFGGPEMGALIPALRENLPVIRKMLDDYNAPEARQMRIALSNIAKVNGVDEATLIKQLLDIRKGDQNALRFFNNLKEAAQRSGDETARSILKAIDEGQLTAASLKELAEAVSAPGSAWNDAQLMGKMYATLIDGTAQWAVEYYGVKPDSFSIRLGNLIRQAQGLMLLDASPTHALQNILDNTLKITREGGILGFAISGGAQKYINDFYHGLAPEGALKGGLAEYSFGERAAPGAIAKAKGTPTDTLSRAERAISALRGKLPVSMGRLSAQAEVKMRTAAFAGGLKKAFNQLWQPGKGFDRMSPDLESAIGVENARAIYSKIAGMNDGQKIIDSLFEAGDIGRTVDEALGDAAASLGRDTVAARQLLDQLGILDQIKEKIPPGATTDQILAGFDEIAQQARREFTKQHREQVMARFEKAMNKGAKEGTLGTLSVFDEIAQMHYEQRIYDIEQWDAIFSVKETGVSGDEIGAAVIRQYEKQRVAYRQLSENVQAMYAGIAEAFGLDSAYGRFLANTALDEHNLWRGFYDTVLDDYKRLRAESAKLKGKDSTSAEWARISQLWAEVREKNRQLYVETNTKALEIQAARNDKVVEMIAARYGEEAATVARGWLDNVRKLTDELYTAVEDFRLSLEQMPREQRGPAWERFRRETYQPLMARRLAENLAGAREVYARAARIEASGGASAPTVAEVTPATKWVEEARRSLLDQLTGYTSEERARIHDLRRIAAQYGLPSADESGKPIPGFDRRLVNTVNKYAATDYREIVEIDPQIAQAALARRAEEKGIALPEELRIAEFPEPPMQDVLRLAGEIEEERLNLAFQGWTKDIPGYKPPEERFAARPETEAVGVAPPGTVDGHSGIPLYDMNLQGWNREVEPLLKAIEDVLLDPTKRAVTAKTLELTPEQTKALRAWAERVRGQLSDAKFAATKYANIEVNMAMLDYDRRYGLDNLANLVIPYQFWYTRSALNWILTAIDRPAWFVQWNRIREMQEELARPVEGFPARLAGKLQIPLPFMPQGWGDTIYVDPWHQIFGFEGMLAQVTRPLARDYSNRVGRASYIIDEMIQDGEITPEEGRLAKQNQSGAIWEQAYAQAQAEVQAEIQTPMDLVGTVFSFSLPLQWALERAGVLSDRYGSGIGGYPIFSTIQNLTSFITPGGINIPETIANALGAAENPAAYRGFLYEYYIQRELANMAANGADVDLIRQAMVDKRGPLWEAAERTAAQQLAVRNFASIFWMDFFPEGEEQQRKLRVLFEQYADQGRLSEFFDEHPEYQARMMLKNWDDPEAMMRQFLISNAWESYNNLTDLEKRSLRSQLGDLFTDSFLNKETRSYDSISTETLAEWVRAMRGVVPETAPGGMGEVVLPTPELSALYDQYLNLPGSDLMQIYWSLPEALRDSFRQNNPQYYAYQDAKALFLMQHPELLPYIIDEDSYLSGAPPEVLHEYYFYLAEKAMYFPMIGATQSQYYSLPKGERRAFLAQHPELRAYWDWNRERKQQLSPQARYYVVGEEKMKEEALGDLYVPPYEVNYDLFPPDLIANLASSALTNRRLGDGSMQALHDVYEAERPPMTFDEWLRLVMQGFYWSAPD